MSLDDWLANGLLVEHRTSHQEIADLFAIVKRDLCEYQTGTHSPEWQLGIAYNAVLQAARAALAAGGYRVPQREGHHYYALQSLAYTIELETDTVRHLDALRKKRNISDYVRAGAVSEREAKDAIALVEKVCADAKRWLESSHPELMSP